MQLEIIELLKNNAALYTLLGASAADSHIHPVNVAISTIPAIAYRFYTISDDGVKRVDKFEITIIDKSLESVELIAEEVRNTLITIGDDGKNNYITDISINGGGLLENIETKTYHKIVNYNITWRE